MKVNKLNDYFCELCEQLNIAEKALYTEFEKEKKVTFYSLYFRQIKIQLVYSWKWENIAPVSVIYCRIYLDKNIPLYLHLPEILSYLKIEDYRACYFPYIETKQRMECCLGALLNIIKDYIPMLESLGMTDQAKEIQEYWMNHNYFQNSEKNDLGFSADEKLSLKNENDRNAALFSMLLQESLMVDRYTISAAYELFLLGDWKHSIKKYKKYEKSGMSDYEKGLCEFMNNHLASEFQPMPEECFTLVEYRKALNQKKEYLEMFLIYVPCAILSCMLMGLINKFCSYQTIFYSGTGAWFGLILGIPIALFGQYTFRYPLKRLLDKNNTTIDFLEIVDNHPWIEKLSKIALIISGIGMIAAGIVFGKMSFRGYENYAVYYTGQGETEQFLYDDIKQIYYIHARHNEFGDRVERASYVVVLQNGKQIDLDAHMSVQKQEEFVNMLFVDINVVQLDSDIELNEIL